VQGVGFRYAALQVAKEFDVTGFVQISRTEGCTSRSRASPGRWRRSSPTVEERMHGHVRKIDRKGAVRPPQFSGFSIR
jgi:acylphosphatase